MCDCLGAQLIGGLSFGNVEGTSILSLIGSLFLWVTIPQNQSRGSRFKDAEAKLQELSTYFWKEETKALFVDSREALSNNHY
jgi:hypothetical protein